MKNNIIYISIAVLLIILLGLGYTIFSNNENMVNPIKVETTIAVTKNAPTDHTSLTASNLPPAPTITQTMPSQLDISTEKNSFVDKIQNILLGGTVRTKKLENLKKIFSEAKTDDEKIAALQSMASLTPIEYVDDLINISKSNAESDKVKVEAVNTLNKTYLVDEGLVSQIGTQNVQMGMKKISQYMDELIVNPATPVEIYNTALQGYSYTNYQKAAPLAKTMLQSKTVLTDNQSGFITNVTFSDKESMMNFSEILSKNPNVITDRMAVNISTFAADPTIAQQMSPVEKAKIISILENHKLARDTENFGIYKDTINGNLATLKAATPASPTN